MLVYHGTDHILEKPQFGIGKSDNDYGSGFYTTEDIDKAKEWAVANGGANAVCNKYKIDLEGLNVLRLDEHGTLAWIAEVIANRGTRSEKHENIGNLLVANYKINTSAADVIVGYRADDSYLTVVDAFLENKLSIDEVERQFRRGNLGEQVFIKSELAFSKLSFEGYEKVKPDENFGNEDIKARKEVMRFLNNREQEISLQGYIPNGILARDAAMQKFEYNKEYKFYCVASDETNQGKNRQRSEKKYEME